MTRRTLTLYNPQQAYKELAELWPWIKAMLIAGHRLTVEVVDAKTRAQENLYHSCFGDFAKSAVFDGEKVDAETWKRMLLYAFFIGTKDDPDYKEEWKKCGPRFIRALDGFGMIPVSIESKKFGRKLASAFITFVHSEGDERGVKWSPASIAMDLNELEQA